MFKTPTVGFEPTSHFWQTIFKTAPFTARARWQFLYAHISLSVSVAISLFNDCLPRLSPILFSKNIYHLLADSVIWPNNCRNRYYAAVSQHLRIGTSVMIFCCLSVGCLPAVYLTCTFTKHLVPPPYLMLYFISAKWGRKELNLQCLPRGNGFTVRRNTTNRCRFPEMRGHLTPYLCTRPRYAYSIKSARHHRNGRIWTFACKHAPNSHKKELNLDNPPLSQLNYVPKPPSDG